MRTEPTPHPVCKALHKPLEFFGIDRRIVVIGFLLGAPWSLMSMARGGFAGFVIGPAIFAVIFAFGKFVKAQDDPAFLRRVFMPRLARTFDAGTTAAVAMERTP
jgi:hypothetical protein